mmetsp:Transcript_16988/g.20878  ORF Transcript_16988/g.20878 Transcript_16988/m.20878 type:complete len:154 (-) Transcript_16988:144-605(-)
MITILLGLSLVLIPSNAFKIQKVYNKKQDPSNQDTERCYKLTKPIIVFGLEIKSFKHECESKDILKTYGYKDDSCKDEVPGSPGKRYKKDNNENFNFDCDGLPRMHAILLIVGIIILVLIIACVICCCCYRKKRTPVHQVHHTQPPMQVYTHA